MDITITMPNDVDLVLGHGACLDGFTSLWVVRLLRGAKAEYREVFYGDPLPDVAGRQVAILDFAPDRPTLEHMARKAASMIVLDHHGTSREALSGLPYAQFDMDRSGARMAFDWIAEDLDEQTRELADTMTAYVQDRDLWRFALPDSRAVSAAMMLAPMTFEAWGEFAFELEFCRDTLVNTGQTVLLSNQRQVESLAKTAQRVKFEGIDVLAANIPYGLTSDVGEALIAEPPGVALLWRYDHAKGRIGVSLRSSDASGVHVGKLAQAHGGGGHEHAAGFSLDAEPAELLSFLSSRFEKASG